MLGQTKKLTIERARLIVLPSLMAAILGFLLTSGSSNRPVQAFSSGPPAGYTGAPREEPAACAECHVPPDAGTGHISITAPQTYTPGQTYPVTVTHTNLDPTRLRWGFEMTVLDSSDEKAGNLQSTDVLTQVLNNQGPGGTRQYIEHTAAGTFVGQQGGASWTFNWTAPATDVGPVTFYAAGNQANNDGNTSGDYIYRTFVASAPASTTPDISISASPSSRAATPGGSAQYIVTVTPLAGFTGDVNLSASGLPAGAGAAFNPTTVDITDASAKTSTVTITTTGATPLGTYPVTITGANGGTMRSAQISLRVISPSSVDLSLTKSASPNPAQVGLNLSYRILVTNSGPAAATNVSVTDNLPATVGFVSSSTSQGMCSGSSAVNCLLGNLPVGANAVITIVVGPSVPGQVTNTASVTASETDFDTTNNTATITTLVQAAAVSPVMLDPNLTVSTVVSGLIQPTSMAFIGFNDFFVLEKTTGKVQRVSNGVLQNSVLDLPVNNASERGLLGIALHPKFSQNGFVYLYWTESSTGIDTSNIDEVPLLGNRVDRYIWNGTSLTFDRNLIRLHAFQHDSGQTSRGNHNGGVLRFGPDDKLYILFGDNGRRGFLQNITSGGPVPDDQFGGPEPDNAHLTGVVLRLNDDGSTPSDNPFFDVNSGLSGEAAANVKKIFAYGIRNGFGMAVDPISGLLWTQENGDDAFDEMNRVRAGFNGGWAQVMGPLNRIDEFKAIESTYGAGNLQQLRWPTSSLADTPQGVLARLYMLPGTQYVDPEFSWKYAVAPAALGFVRGRGLGSQFESDMFVGASRTTLLNGYLFRFKLTSDRFHFSFTDSRLSDLVADNTDKFDQTESESLVIGRDFGVTTDIETGPNGNVFVVSLSNGAVYEIKSKPTQLFVATLTGAQEVPATNSPATGTATLLLSPDETTAQVALTFSGLTSAQTAAHIHGPALPGVSAPVLFPLPPGQISDFQISLTAAQVQDLKNGLHYINVHSNNFPNGEIRGQFQSIAAANSIQFAATTFTKNEGQGSATISVSRLGNTATATSIDYATADGSASSRTDYVTASGTLQFAAGETVKQFSVPIIDDLYVEGPETINLSLSKPSGGAFPGSPFNSTITILDDDTAPPAANPLDDAQFFVRQQYLDFLSREPDPGGLTYWTNEIIKCGIDQTCIKRQRVAVSAAFFIEAEFQQTGSFVYGLYKGALGRQPNYAEFTADRSRVVGGANLAASKDALAADFVARSAFLQLYPVSMTNSHFVNKMFDTAALLPFSVERQQEIDAMNAGRTRAQVVEDVIEIPAFNAREFNPSFVLMQYFGYLRRDPDPGGYTFWLDIVNNREPNNYIGMVCAFITSPEYQQRFSPVTTRANSDCAGIN
ncbi:MAG TPA: PQQ-dependent sugar dehydrogenase [Pyrinomonadaceae bacterium]